MRLPGPLIRSFLAALPALSCALLFPGPAPAAPAPFHEIPGDLLVPEFTYPAGTRYFDLDPEAVRTLLAGAPSEEFAASRTGLAVALPLPGNRSETFSVWETDLMHPDLAARYPEIRTYRGRGIDNPRATVRLTVTPAGFHGMIRSQDPTVFIDPVSRGNNRHHASHARCTAPPGDDPPFACALEAGPDVEADIARLVETRRNAGLRTTGQQLRTYRVCVAATGEYTAFHGGTVALGQAAIAVSMNRVSGIFEDELSIRLQLVANNDQVVYTNSGTDGYTNTNGSTDMGSNQSTLDAVIGSANYDVGHVFGTGTGGVAGLGVACRAGLKARGASGVPVPIGDAFDVSFVAHEMGHQFGANHTFNGTAGSCAGRNGLTAYEPGSGVTIMAYAGLCSSHNIATGPIDNFHAASIDEIAAYTEIGSGSTCPVTTPTGNNPPVAIAGNAGLTLPAGTPFLLSGAMTEPDGDPVTFGWEQFDLGPGGNPTAPIGNAPIFRNWPPVAEEWRMFPQRSDVRNGTSTIGEILPTYSRTLTFRLCVRDGRSGVGCDLTTLTVDGASGPFVVTSVDTTPWEAGATRTITWDVAGTDVSPVSCALVNILLSTDDGVTFPHVLIAGTPNDGSETIAVPAFATTSARVQVEAVGNVFFNMSDAPFTISVTNVGVEELAAPAVYGVAVLPNPFSAATNISFSTAHQGPVIVTVYDAAGRRVQKVTDRVLAGGRHTVGWNGRDAAGTAVAAGLYLVRVETVEGSETTRAVHLK